MRQSFKLLGCLATAVVLLFGCRATSDTRDFSLRDVGSDATIVTLNTLRAQRMIREGKYDDAIEYLNSTQLYQLALVRIFDAHMVEDERNLRLRNKLVTELQEEWLQHPPKYLDDAAAEYLERICATIAGCPRGRIQPRAPLPDFQFP